VSVLGAYGDVDPYLLITNLEANLRAVEEAGGQYTLSAFTRAKTGKSRLDRGNGQIRFKIYPQSEDIRWAADRDIQAGTVADAPYLTNTELTSKELLPAVYTKAPHIEYLDYVKPNLIDITNETRYNELGVNLRGNNFRIEYDADIPQELKRLINKVNKMLDEKYGKVIKTAPRIESKPTIQKEITEYKEKDFIPDTDEQLNINLAVNEIRRTITDYPRSLIRSEVKINDLRNYFDSDEYLSLSDLEPDSDISLDNLC